MLEKTQDTNGNFVSYSYYKDSGQIYPDTITYTNNGITNGIFSVTFSRTSRTDAIQDTSPGFQTVTNYEVSQIQTFISGTWAHKYVLAYTAQSPSPRSLLSSITESGQANSTVTSLPAESFNYANTATGGWALSSPYSNLPSDQFEIDFATMTGGTVPQVNGHNVRVSLATPQQNDWSVFGELVDVNGDGLPDIVQSMRCIGSCIGTGYPGLDNTYVYLNNGNGWTYDSAWSSPADQYSIDYATMLHQSPPQVNGHNIKIDLDTPHATDGAIAGELIDVNGDGLPDIVQSLRPNSGATADLDNAYVYLNTGSGWVYDSAWTTPTDQYSIDIATVQSGTPLQINGHNARMDLNTAQLSDGSTEGELLDVNGDGLPDIVQSQRYRLGTAGIDKSYIYLNTGSGWTYDSSWTVPADQYNIDSATMVSGTPIQVNGHNAYVSLNTSHTSDNTVFGELVDVNGDGLPDIVQSTRCIGSCIGTGYPGLDNTYVYLNTGDGWAYDSSWSMSQDQYSVDYATMLSQSPPQVSGHNIRLDLNTAHVSDGAIYGTMLTDVNGDGLPDIVQSLRPGSGATADLDNAYLYLNTGHGWVYSSSFSTPTDQYNIDLATLLSGTPTQVNGRNARVDLDTSRGNDGAVFAQMPDLNGDGLPDFMQSLRYRYGTGGIDSPYIYLSSAARPLLSSITLPQGGSYTMTYKPSTQYVDGGGALLNPNTPFVVMTLNQLTINDGFGNAATTSYSYAGGKYYFDSTDPTTRKFAGFNVVTKTDPVGNVTKEYFHQGNGTDSSHGEYSDDYFKIGKAYRVEQYDNAGHLESKTINKWDDYSLGTGTKFVKLAQSVDYAYDGGSTHKDKAEGYSYDNTTGNMTQKVEYGQVTGNDDGTFTDTGSDLYTTNYTYVSGGSVVGLPDDVVVTNQSSAKVKESKYFYDTSTTLGTVTKGNLTEQDGWLSGTTYATNKKTYDGTFGLVTQQLDPDNNATNYSYDSYNLYPTTVTNALTQAAYYTYDYQSGKVIQTTDVNGLVFKNTYDGLERTTLVQQPDITTPTTLDNKTAYTYTDTQGAVSVAESDYMDSSNALTSYTYLDGLGRTIQQRQSAEDSGNFNAKDSSYNALGLLSAETLPYVSTGTAKTAANTTASLQISYVYDALGRITSTSNALGSTTNAYTPWQVTVTDANGHNKDLINDAYGNLTQVNEYNGGTYTTTYAYDYLQDLTKITDALGNIRDFTYDGLGRRLTAEDLHPSSSVAFGTWNYTYDNAGNMLSVVDPGTNTINYVFDALNRETKEKLGATVKVTYTYDSCTDGIGRLCTVANPSVSTSYTYNDLGLIAKQISTIGSTPYETDFTYDRQQHQLLITNPDGSKVQYTYNLAGLPETIQRKELADASFKNVVTNFDYSPQGGVAVISYANSSTTTSTYDSTKLYRLTQKVTSLNGANVQNIAYVYDAVGNVKNITDSSTTDTNKNIAYAYDNLNRLTSYTVTSAVNGNNHSETYSYNAIGDLTSKSDIGTLTYAGTGYPDPDAVTAIGSTTYTYDNNGNLKTVGATLTNTWDYNNRLTQTVAGGNTITYAYDQSGARIQYTAAGSTTYYPTQYYNITGTKPTKHIYANGQIVADIVGTGAGGVNAAAAHYVNTDHITGSNIVSNDAKTTQEVLDYYPFGSSRLDEQTSFNEQVKYAGHVFDSATAFSYMNSRYYNSAVGRFLSEDPLFNTIGFDLSDPQTLNSYSYVTNNPLRYIDVTGQKRTDYVSPATPPTAPGQPAGTYKGVQLYAGDGSPSPSNAQCVVAVQNLYRALFGIDLRYGLGAAYNYADLSAVSKGQISHYAQGSSTMPQENDIITWGGGAYGHIGLISEVDYNSQTNTGTVYTVEQNHNLTNQTFKYGLTGTIGADGQLHYYVNGNPLSWQRPSNESAPSNQQSSTTGDSNTNQSQQRNQSAPWYKQLWNSILTIF